MRKILSAATVIAIGLGISLFSTAQAKHHEAPENGMENHKESLLIQQPENAEFMSVPGVPECTTIAPLRGDMSKEASTLMVRMTPGCLVPFHWHTPTEELIVLQGTPYAQMLGKKPQVLSVGSYSQLLSGHIHRFRCMSEIDCLIFLVADAAFDIHFVDDKGEVISTEEALKRAAESADDPW